MENQKLLGWRNGHLVAQCRPSKKMVRSILLLAYPIPFDCTRIQNAKLTMIYLNQTKPKQTRPQKKTTNEWYFFLLHSYHFTFTFFRADAAFFPVIIYILYSFNDVVFSSIQNCLNVVLDSRVHVLELCVYSISVTSLFVSVACGAQSNSRNNKFIPTI